MLKNQIQKLSQTNGDNNNGVQYVENFKKNKQNGQYYIYTGEMVDGQEHGYGYRIEYDPFRDIIIMENKYEGKWKGGKKHGKGVETLYYPNSEGTQLDDGNWVYTEKPSKIAYVLKGKWKNGNRIGLFTIRDGNDKELTPGFFHEKGFPVREGQMSINDLITPVNHVNLVSMFVGYCTVNADTKDKCWKLLDTIDKEPETKANKEKLENLICTVAKLIQEIHSKSSDQNYGQSLQHSTYSTGDGRELLTAFNKLHENVQNKLFTTEDINVVYDVIQNIENIRNTNKPNVQLPQILPEKSKEAVERRLNTKNMQNNQGRGMLIRPQDAQEESKDGQHQQPNHVTQHKANSKRACCSIF